MLSSQREKKQSKTNVFGIRTLLALGVEVLGKQLDSDRFTSFLSIKELIDYKK